MIAVLGFAAAATLLIASAVLITASLRIDGRASFAVAVFIVCAAIVVSGSIVLSLARHLTALWLLVWQSAVLAMSIAVWLRGGRPRPPQFALKRIRALVKGRPALALLLSVAALALALQAAMAVLVAPNEGDALLYHLPRAVRWLEMRSANQYITDATGTDRPEVVAPPNGELLQTWTMAFTHSDRFVQFVQWFSLVGLVLAIFVLARLAGAGGSAAAWPAGLIALMPSPLLESSSGQNDLIVTFFGVAAIAFVVRSLRRRSISDAAIASIAFGLAVGTKLTFVYTVPCIALVVVGCVVVYRPPVRFLVLAAGFAVSAVFALGSFNYIQNVVNGRPVTGFTGSPKGYFARDAPDFVKVDPLKDTARVAWMLVDASGLLRIPDSVQNQAGRLSKPLFAGAHGSLEGGVDPPIRIDPFEDGSAFGLVGLVLLPLALLKVLSRRSSWLSRILAAGALAGFLAYTLSLGAHSEAPRYLMPSFVLAVPLLATLDARPVARWLALAVTVAAVPTILLGNPSKPIVAKQPIFALDRLGQLALPNDRPWESALRRLSTLIPAREPIGFVWQVGSDGFDPYLLYDPHFKRRVVRFEPTGVSLQAMQRARVSGVFIASLDPPSCTGELCRHLPSGLDTVRLGPRSFLVLPRRK